MALADVVGDATAKHTAGSAFEKGVQALLTPREENGPLWNATKSFFTAHSETSTQVFTDSLYGQMLSHHVLGEFTVNTTYLKQHLEYEWQENQDVYGMRVLSSPIQEDSIWMNGPPTWTYLQLALGEMPQAEALEPFKRMSENFRTRMHDMWNLRALTHSQTEGTALEHGQPREQGHYGFMLTDLYLYMLFTGQRVNMAAGTLSLSPKFPPPYVVPVLIAGVQGSLEARETGTGKTNMTLRIAFGTLQLPNGGFRVGDDGGCGLHMPSGSIRLGPDESATWTC